MNFTRTLGFSLCLALAAPLPALAQQQPRPQQNVPAAGQNGAQGFLRARHDAVNRILRRPARTPAEQARLRDELGRALADLLDYDELSRQSLASHWAEHSETERREFVGLLRQLVQQSYQRSLRTTLDFDIRYLSETPGQGGAVVVRTTARSRTQRRAPQVAIDYTLKRAGNAWRVSDVSTDGVSLVRNYRTQFNRIITREGWPALIQRMRSRLDAGSEI